jgi:hypothetical protein
MFSTYPSPSCYPPIDWSASSSEPRVIVTAQCSDMRSPRNVSHRGRVRADTTDHIGVGNKRRRAGESWKIRRGSKSACRTPPATMDFLYILAHGERKPALGGEPRRGEQHLSRTGVRDDRVGTVEDLREGGFLLPFPPNFGTIGVK